LHGEDIDSSGTDRIQGTILAVVWREHGKAGKFSDIFVGNLHVT